MSRYLKKPDNVDIDRWRESKDIKIDTWYPKDKFYESPSFSASFIENIGGNHFFDLWTRRNLYVISNIFDRILKVGDADIKNNFYWDLSKPFTCVLK